MDPEIVGALIGPVLTAGLAAVAVGFKEWRRRRETADQRHETLQQAADEVAFIDAWLTAYAKIATDTQQRERAPRALADLERSYAAMTASHQAAATATQARTWADLLARILLLRLRRPGAKVLRVFYYIFAVLGFLFTLAGMSGGFRRAGEGLGFLILVGMVFTLMSFSPAILFYALVRLADRPPRTLGSVSAESPAGPPDYPAWPDHSYPGPVPIPPRQVGAGYPPSG
ncbi:MAG TPA: hypothetical protein VGW74_07250 [Propionibacteriaceae bacterium]|nr:hypothetical protein [Propionibacteriaceae bacterium]